MLSGHVLSNRNSGHIPFIACSTQQEMSLWELSVCTHSSIGQHPKPSGSYSAAMRYSASHPLQPTLPRIPTDSALIVFRIGHAQQERVGSRESRDTPYRSYFVESMGVEKPRRLSRF